MRKGWIAGAALLFAACSGSSGGSSSSGSASSSSTSGGNGGAGSSSGGTTGAGSSSGSSGAASSGSSTSGSACTPPTGAGTAVGDGGFPVAATHQYRDPTSSHDYVNFGLYSEAVDCTGNPLDAGRLDDLRFTLELPRAALGPGTYVVGSNSFQDGGSFFVDCHRDWQDGSQGGGDYPSGSVTVSQIDADGTLHGTFDLGIGTNGFGFAGPLTGTFDAPPCTCP